MPRTSALLRNHGAALPCVAIACLPAEDEQAASGLSNPLWGVKSQIPLTDRSAHRFKDNPRKAGATCPSLHWPPRSSSTLGRYLATFGWPDNLSRSARLSKRPYIKEGSPIWACCSTAPPRVLPPGPPLKAAS